ncbi:MAG: hypothetical protein ACR2HJ_09260 [Fimbriimonadales bacterium]
MADNGDAIGGDTLGTGTEHSLYYSGGKVIDIGIQGDDNDTAARGLNNLGQITGLDYDGWHFR